MAALDVFYKLKALMTEGPDDPAEFDEAAFEPDVGYSPMKDVGDADAEHKYPPGHKP